MQKALHASHITHYPPFILLDYFKRFGFTRAPNDTCIVGAAW